MRINHPELCSLSAESVLLIVTLKVVHSIHAFLIEHYQTFVRGPAELDNFALIPLFLWSNSVFGVHRLRSGTDRNNQESLSRR